MTPILRSIGLSLMALAALATIAVGLTAEAAVVRFEIQSRQPLAEGKEFGDVGAYERIVGRIYYEIDPDLRQNQDVVDLKLAPRNPRGKVEVWGDLFILAPRELSKGNGALLYDVNNRGNKLALRFFNNAESDNDPRTASRPKTHGSRWRSATAHWTST